MVKTQNIDVAGLNEYIEKSGIRIGHIADTIGISRQAFDKKRKGINKFRLAETYVLADLLRMSDAEKNRIFFPPEVSGNANND